MRYPTYSTDLARAIRDSGDPVRYGSMALAIARIQQESIRGAFAEVGVWQGYTSEFIHSQAPDRAFHLFDTFTGFPDQDIENGTKSDQARFRDTNLAAVRTRVGHSDRIVFHPGYFPETAQGLENELFAFVLLDLDLYNPTYAGLEFFYPRLVPGGYLFLHDYNSTESEHAVRRALECYMMNKPEPLIELPDAFGSAVIRKMHVAQSAPDPTGGRDF